MDPDVSGASVGTENGYTALAAGEPLPMVQPSDTNHIQFHGGFLEDQNIHTTQGTEFELHRSRHAISECVCQSRFYLEHTGLPAIEKCRPHADTDTTAFGRQHDFAF